LLPEELEIEMDDLEVALRLLQACDPRAIGARDLAETLSLQLLTEPNRAAAISRSVSAASISTCWRRATSRNLRRACRLRTTRKLKAAHALLLAQNPRPGAQYAVIDHPLHHA